jgi:hypothetical protein
VGTILLMVLASVLYVAMLTTVSFSAGGGEAGMGEALVSFFFTVALWIVLALLAGAAAIMGEVPRRIIMISAVLVPLAGVDNLCRPRHVLTPYQMGCHRTGLVAAAGDGLCGGGALRKTTGCISRQRFQHYRL